MKKPPIKHRQTGQNRLCVHLLAQAAGISYEDMKARLFPMSLETPLSLAVTKDLIRRIQDRTDQPTITSWRKPA